ncbi:MAG: alpha/beta hydrolase [Halobacteriovoraceae bacterium]|nr:alpha/beta hydrolase [Halobacteriovoraceae bacterium]
MKANLTIVNSHIEETITLINGLFVGKESWKDIVPAFSDRYRIVLYDGRCQGINQGWNEDFTLQDLTHDLLEILNYANVEKTLLLGLSNGGRVALKFAELFPQRVSSVFACDTYANLTPLLKMKLCSWLLANQIGGPLHRFDVATPWIWGESTLQKSENIILKYRENARKISKKAARLLINSALSGNINLGKINRPVYLFFGKEDLLTPQSYHQDIANRLLHSVVFELDGGHASLIEYPNQAYTILRPLVDKIFQGDCVEAMDSNFL